MTDVLYFSIAGKKSNEVITSVLEELLILDYIPSSDKDIIKHCLQVVNHGNYPARDYFEVFFEDSGLKYNALAELLNYTQTLKDFYKRQYINRGIIGVVNEAMTSTELIEGVSKVIDDNDSRVGEDDFEQFKPIIYSEAILKPFTEGYQVGVPEIDSLTNGFQPGTVGCFAAFVAEGKSTITVSFVFKSALAKKKVALFSLEMSPEIVWAQIQARYLFEVKGLEITSQDLIFKRLTEEMEAKVKEYDDDFRRDICANLLIVDESTLSKSIVGDAKQIKRVFKKLEQVLRGLDITAWDHIGQLELMYPTMGNQIVRNITSATKTHINLDGIHPFTAFAVQTNREGRKRAARRDGVYDLAAISDLNEVERSCTYCIFLFTTEDSKIVQETKISMIKHRLGGVLSEPAVITFNPAISTVGTNVEKVSMSGEGFASVFGDSGFDADF